jgi:hypothetical protein
MSANEDKVEELMNDSFGCCGDSLSRGVTCLGGGGLTEGQRISPDFQVIYQPELNNQNLPFNNGLFFTNKYRCPLFLDLKLGMKPSDSITGLGRRSTLDRPP